MDRKFLRPGWIVGHLLVVLAVLVCLRLGRWQWDRMHEGGTIQNFGYAVLWPVFGAAFVYMWFRFLQLENLKDAEDDAELTALAAGGPAGESLQVSGAATVEPGPDTGTPGSPSADPARSAPRTEAGKSDSTGPADDTPPPPDSSAERPPSRVSRTTPSTGVTVAVATVGDDDDDPELAAYNRALAALAEKDHRRAR